MNLENVHKFDKKLKGKFTPKKIIPNEEKTKIFSDLIQKCKHETSKNMIKIMINDLNTGRNMDLENEIDASDILVDICSKDIDEIMDFFEEQLKDIMTLGPCSQGRTVRLFQIWQALE